MARTCIQLGWHMGKLHQHGSRSLLATTERSTCWHTQPHVLSRHLPGMLSFTYKPLQGSPVSRWNRSIVFTASFK